MSLPFEVKSLRVFAAALVVLAFAAYANSLTGPFVLDDELAIAENPAIRRLWPLEALLFPPAHSPLVGRPLASLTFAFNYRFGGTAVVGYHVVNLVIHVCAGLVLFGIVRRTLLLTRDSTLKPVRPDKALWFAWFVAALWLVHPILTATVTYISQRTEALMALFYLLTLYAFIRGAGSLANKWLSLSVGACALGMACKEVMVTAPVVVLLYDCAFVAGSIREAWRARWKYYSALFATWLLLAFLMQTGEGARNVGFGYGVTPWTYAQTESFAVLRYLWLVFWPQSLVFDYGPVFVAGAKAVPFIAALLVLLAGTSWLFLHFKRVGFLAATFFLLLAPTSSIVPVAGQPIAENRVYLPSIALLALFGWGLQALVGRRAVFALVPLLIAGGVLTHQRNKVYDSAVALWKDSVGRWPESPRAQSNLGQAYFTAGEYEKAAAHFEAALRIDPQWVDALLNLGAERMRRGEMEPAIALYTRAAELSSHYAPAHFGLANALFRAGRKREAVSSYEAALHIRPDHAEAHRNLGVALTDLGQTQAGIEHLERAVQLRPESAEAQFALGAALASMARLPEAVARYEKALQLNPAFSLAKKNLSVAHSTLGVGFYQQGKFADAVAHFEAALRFDPSEVEHRQNIAAALSRLGRDREAIEHYQALLRVKPNHAEAIKNLGLVLAKTGRLAEAIAAFETALRLRPDDVISRDYVVRLRAEQTGRNR